MSRTASDATNPRSPGLDTSSAFASNAAGAEPALRAGPQ